MGGSYVAGLQGFNGSKVLCQGLGFRVKGLGRSYTFQGLWFTILVLRLICNTSDLCDTSPKDPQTPPNGTEVCSVIPLSGLRNFQRFGFKLP